MEIFHFIIISIISMLELGKDTKLIPIANLGNTMS